MMRRSLTALALAILAAAPLAAQQPAGSKAMKSDPDKKVAAIPMPKGWESRNDRPNTPPAQFVAMGTGLHVTSGPAAIYWNPADKVNGPFTATVTYTQTKAPAHPEAYGLVLQGDKLDAPDLSYVYVLVRGDGKFMVNHRAGADVHKIIDWKEHSALVKADAAGKATNTITIDATRSDSVRVMLNGKQAAAFESKYMNGGKGQVGLRVNHNLDVHVAGYKVTKM